MRSTKHCSHKPRPARHNRLDEFRCLSGHAPRRRNEAASDVGARPKARGFTAEAQRQATILRGAPEEDKALGLIEAATDCAHTSL